MPAVPVSSSPRVLTLPRSRAVHLAAIFALTKPRLAAMSVLTTMVAFATTGTNRGATLATLAGTALAAAGALSLNQWWERQADAIMTRTQRRPLPLGQLSATEALGWSVGFSVAGIAVLILAVNNTAAVVAAAIILLYGVVYTPLKRRSRWATEVGAVSGALPALLGNAAAGALLAPRGLTLLGILLFWQMPHFFAIGWRHRKDYRAAGFALLPAVDPTGHRTALWSLGYTILLVLASLIPWMSGQMGATYGWLTLAANAWLLRAAWRFVVDENRDRTATPLFVASLIYLPVVMAALIGESFIERLG